MKGYSIDDAFDDGGAHKADDVDVHELEAGKSRGETYTLQDGAINERCGDQMGRPKGVGGGMPWTLLAQQEALEASLSSEMLLAAKRGHNKGCLLSS